MDHFRSLLDFKHRACEVQDRLLLFAVWNFVEIFAIPPSRRSVFYGATHTSLVVFLCSQCSFNAQGGFSSMNFVDPSSLWFGLKAWYAQSPNFYELLFQGSHMFSVSMVASLP